MGGFVMEKSVLKPELSEDFSYLKVVLRLLVFQITLNMFAMEKMCLIMLNFYIINCHFRLFMANFCATNLMEKMKQ